MLHSKIEEILKETIGNDEELLNDVKYKFHAIEHEIDNMANDGESMEDILKRAKILIERIFGTVWVSKKWSEIERDIKHNLKDLKEKE